MTTAPWGRWALPVLLCAVCALAACGASSQSRFYTLAPMPGAETPAGPENGPCMGLGVGPVSLPTYLERPQMVTRPSEGQYNLAEYDRWAEPLQDTVHRVLAENLAAQICAAPLAFYPWPSSTMVDRQVVVQVLRLDTVEGGETMLKANWWILGPEGRQLVWRAANYHQTAAGSSYADYAAAQSRLLEALSRDIAQAIAELLPPDGRK